MCSRSLFYVLGFPHLRAFFATLKKSQSKAKIRKRNKEIKTTNLNNVEKEWTWPERKEKIIIIIILNPGRVEENWEGGGEEEGERPYVNIHYHVPTPPWSGTGISPQHCLCYFFLPHPK